MKAIIRGAHLAGAINCWTRHATPQPFAHLLTAGVGGRGALAALDPAASGLFVFGHPTLGDWSAIPALGKRPDGGVLHAWMGITSDDGGAPLTADEFAALDVVELYVRGHVLRFVNGHDRNGVEFVGLELTQATLLDSVQPQFVPWRSDQPGALPDEYKADDGSPIVDPALATIVQEVRWPA